MIIEAINKYISELECLQGFKNEMNVNFLKDKGNSYIIEQLPTQPTIKKYADGSELQQIDFAFICRVPYAKGVENNLYDNFIDEIKTNNKINKLPKLKEGYTSQSISIVNTTYEGATNFGVSVYQINLKFKYIKE